MQHGSHVFIDAEGSGADVVPTLNFQPLLMNVGGLCFYYGAISGKIKDKLVGMRAK